MPTTTEVARAPGNLRLPEDQIFALTDALRNRHENVLRFRRGVATARSPVQVEDIAWYRLAKRPRDRGATPSRYIQFACGDYYLQDAGSLLALAACDADEDWTQAFPRTASREDPLLICDLCAAPGGKASALLEAVADHGFVLANEAIRSRVAPLVFNLSRTGSDRFAVTNIDPAQLAAALGGIFDLVLVDAPCSGQALVARGKQSASALSPRQIEHSAARQERILDAAIQLTREGGRLIYSTCTFAERENEMQIRRLVDAGQAESVRVDRLRSYQSLSQPACYRLWPHRHDCDGSFAASVRVTSRSIAARRWKGRRSEKAPADLSPWFDWDPSQFRLHTIGSSLLAWPADAPDWFESFAVAGPEIAHRTGATWKPSHAAALRRSKSIRGRDSVDVMPEVASRFLSGHPIPCERTGWQIVRCFDAPLGWIKCDGRFGKNHLLAAARFNASLRW